MDAAIKHKSADHMRHVLIIGNSHSVDAFRLLGRPVDNHALADPWTVPERA